MALRHTPLRTDHPRLVEADRAMAVLRDQRALLDGRPVAGEHLLDRPFLLDDSVVQPDAPPTHGLHRGEVVRHEHEGGPLCQHRAHPVEALLLEPGIADGQYFVYEQDVRLEERGDGEPQAHLHARGVVLDLSVDRVPDLGELDDLVEASRHLAAAEPEDAIRIGRCSPCRSGLRGCPPSPR